MGYVRVQVWEAVVFGMNVLKNCSGCLGTVCSTLLLWLSCSIAQVTAKGSEKGEE